LYNEKEINLKCKINYVTYSIKKFLVGQRLCALNNLILVVKDSMVLRRISGPRRDEVTGEWRRLHNEGLNDLYSSPNIVKVIKSRRLRWAGHVARMGQERGCIGYW